jgi:hypothetical protein
MNKTPQQIPTEFDALPEPGRSKAFEFFKELLEGGADEQGAIQQAHDRALNWASERLRPAEHRGNLPQPKGG